MTGLRSTFAAALRAAREAAGWSQAELAERIGLSVEAYGRLERGRVLPRTATLVRVAQVLRISTDELLGRADGPRQAISGAAGEKEIRLRGVIARLEQAGAEDLRFLVIVLGLLQRWRKDVDPARSE